MIRQGPPQRRRHPVGVKGTKRVAFARTDGGHEIVEPHRPVVVVEGQNGSTGAATANAGLNHVLNLEGVEG